MRIEWYVNGRPVLTGSRVKTNFEFGFLSLDASGVIAEDSGTYTARAVNALGEATASCEIQVLGESSAKPDGIITYKVTYFMPGAGTPLPQ